MHLNPFTEEDDSDSRHYVINTHRAWNLCLRYYRIADTYQRIRYLIRGKNSFAERSKISAGCRSEK